ncbi:hypothetical protein LTR09_004518 [Extremus antarcticus]|uniref:Uncharacterized protein n=1 Tax=Extremus antarcticus TaxID=702011 RepID=A0AAJ0DHZ2_9PEZI|nr:hypothetical protein LTR09_004518 [Extremus antarcticus]
MPRVFFVTGCSSGFGRELAQVLLDAGENVVATARKPTTITSFRNASESNFLPLKLDVTKQSDIKAAFDDAVSKFGRIDVLINNAAYCLAGPFETLSESQIRSQFDTNVFAVMEITRGALEIMRTQSPSGGLIMQNSSISGQLSFPLVSVYSASKFAVSGWTLGIAAEVKPEWNIKFCVVEPGPFRTPGVGSNLVVGDLPNKHYDHLDARAFFDTMDGKQPGDTTKGAQAMYKLSQLADPPLRVVLGKLAHDAIQQKIADDQKLYSRQDVVDIVTDCEWDQ